MSAETQRVEEQRCMDYCVELQHLTFLAVIGSIENKDAVTTCRAMLDVCSNQPWGDCKSGTTIEKVQERLRRQAGVRI